MKYTDDFEEHQDYGRLFVGSFIKVNGTRFQHNHKGT